MTDHSFRLCAAATLVIACAVGVIDNVYANQVEQQDEVSTLSGDIVIDNTMPSKDVSTVNGNITLRSGSKANDLTAFNGTITLQDSARANDIFGAKHSVILSPRAMANDISTLGGDIRLANHVQAGDVSSISGNISTAENVTVDEVSSINGNIRIGTGNRIKGDINNATGQTYIDRRTQIQGNLGTAIGAVGIVDSTIHGNITAYDSDLTVDANSRVQGNIFYCASNPKGFISSLFNRLSTNDKQQRTESAQKAVCAHSTINRKHDAFLPTVIIGKQAIVDGDLTFQRRVRLYVHETAKIGKVNGAEVIRFNSDKPVIK